MLIHNWIYYREWDELELKHQDILKAHNEVEIYKVNKLSLGFESQALGMDIDDEWVSYIKWWISDMKCVCGEFVSNIE